METAAQTDVQESATVPTTVRVDYITAVIIVLTVNVSVTTDAVRWVIAAISALLAIDQYSKLVRGMVAQKINNCYIQATVMTIELAYTYIVHRYSCLL